MQRATEKASGESATTTLPISRREAFGVWARIGLLSFGAAAIVGVVLDLAIWFAVHAVFGHVEERRFGPIQLLIPEWHSLSLPALILTVLAMVAMFRFKLGMGKTLAGSAMLGVVWKVVFA